MLVPVLSKNTLTKTSKVQFISFVEASTFFKSVSVRAVIYSSIFFFSKPKREC